MLITTLKRCMMEHPINRLLHQNSKCLLVRFYPKRCCTKRVRDFSVKSGCGEQFDDVVDGFVGAVVGGFELAVRAVFGVGTMVEAAVGERTAEPLVKEEEEQGNLYALLRGEPVGVSGTVAFH